MIVVEAARGRSPSQILGGYSVTTTSASYQRVAGAALDPLPRRRARPLALRAAVRGAHRARRERAPSRSARCARSAPRPRRSRVWLTIEVGVFASHWSQRIEERNLFYVAPLFLIALFAWIERGQPRPPRAVVAAAGVAAALPGAIPFLGLMNINAQSDTPFLQPWWYLGDRVAGRGNVALLAVVTSDRARARSFLWLPRRYAPVLPALVALGFFLTWLPLQLWIHSFPRLSSAAYSTGHRAPGKSWIDNAVGRNADVTIVWTRQQPVPRLGERVLEPERQARVRPRRGHADRGRGASRA